MRTIVSTDRLTVRRFLLKTQSLLNDNPSTNLKDRASVLQMIKDLECIQIDPVAAVERNQHLVLAARNPQYRPEQLEQLLADSKVFEYIANAACVIPIEDYPIFEPTRQRILERVNDQLMEMDPVVQEILKKLKKEGPLPSRSFQSTKRVHGYWDNTTPKTKETSLALNLLLDAGIIHVARREGTERFFDLPEKAIAEDIVHQAKTVDPFAAKQALIDKYIRAYRIFDAQDQRFGWVKMNAGERRAEIDRRIKEGMVIPLQIEGVERPYYMLSEDIDRLEEISRGSRDSAPIEGPIRFLPPLDNLLWRRERLVDLFDFNYKWEIYIPEAKRQYGYYAMPILYGDQLIGRIDPRLDRKEQILHIRFLQIEKEVPITTHLLQQLSDALISFAKFHKAERIRIQRAEPGNLRLSI